MIILAKTFACLGLMLSALGFAMLIRIALDRAAAAAGHPFPEKPHAHTQPCPPQN